MQFRFLEGLYVASNYQPRPFPHALAANSPQWCRGLLSAVVLWNLAGFHSRRQGFVE